MESLHFNLAMQLMQNGHVAIESFKLRNVALTIIMATTISTATQNAIQYDSYIYTPSVLGYQHRKIANTIEVTKDSIGINLLEYFHTTAHGILYRSVRYEIGTISAPTIGGFSPLDCTSPIFKGQIPPTYCDTVGSWSIHQSLKGLPENLYPLRIIANDSAGHIDTTTYQIYYVIKGPTLDSIKLPPAEEVLHDSLHVQAKCVSNSDLPCFVEVYFGQKFMNLGSHVDTTFSLENEGALGVALWLTPSDSVFQGERMKFSWKREVLPVGTTKTTLPVSHSYSVWQSDASGRKTRSIKAKANRIRFNARK